MRYKRGSRPVNGCQPTKREKQPLNTHMTLALLQELLMALRANDADDYKSLLAPGIQELGRDVAAEVESD